MTTSNVWPTFLIFLAIIILIYAAYLGYIYYLAKIVVQITGGSGDQIQND